MVTETFPGQTWVCWDFINFAWLIDPTWVPTRLVPMPTLDNELMWIEQSGTAVMLEATEIDRDAVFRDFFRKLDAHSSARSRG